MPKVIRRDFQFGGHSGSRFYGSRNQFSRSVGFDIHSSSGLVKTNQKMTENSAGVVTELCKSKLKATNGIRYWFSSASGKIWQDKAGTYTLVHTLTPAAGEAKVLGAAEFESFIYIFTQSRVHRIATANADGAAAWTANIVEDWATFTATDLEYHPSRIINLVLYIGDGKYVAQVEAGVFTGNAADMPTGYRVSALGKDGVDLVIGTDRDSNICSIIYWNGWSVSFSYEEELNEDVVNAFIEGNPYLVSAGSAGHLYRLGGLGRRSQFLEYGSIPGTFSPTATARVYPEAWGIFRGKILFGVSNVTGNPCDQGAWSYTAAGNIAVRNLEFPISEVDGDGYPAVSSIEIGAILVDGDDVYMNWKDADEAGVDKLDYTAKIAKPFMELPVIAPDRANIVSFPRAEVDYASLPSGTSIVIKTRQNLSGSFSAAQTVKDDTDRKMVYYEVMETAKTRELRIEGVSSGNNAPEIEEIRDIISYGRRD